MPNIGIVGVSPYGAALCHKEIISALSNSLDDPKLYPEIIIHNYPFYRYLEKGPKPNNDWRDVHSLICSSITKVKNCGADFVIIPANTVHYQFDNLQESADLPIINLLQKTVDLCLSNNVESVTVIGTNYTISGGLYEHYFNRAKIKIKYLQDKYIKFFDELIKSDLIYGTLCEEKLSKANEIINNLKTETDTVLLACTELTVLQKSKIDNGNIIDTLGVLADSAIEASIRGL